MNKHFKAFLCFTLAALALVFVSCAHTHVHKFQEFVAEKPATCEVAGQKGYQHCDECGKNYDKDGVEITDLVIPALGHDLKHVDRKEATCEEDGNIEYWHCERCGENFSDAEGKNKVTEVKTNKLGHDYELKATWLGGNAAHYLVCKNNNEHVINSNAEGYSATVTSETVDPECSTKGSTTYTLTVTYDGKTYTATNVIELAALGHNIIPVKGQAATTQASGYLNYFECQNCHTCYEDENGETPISDIAAWKAEGGNGYIAPIDENHEHVYTKINGKNPTCEEAGYKDFYYCTLCGTYFATENDPTSIIADLDAWVLAEGKINALGHDLEEVRGEDATQTEAGYKSFYTCSECDKDFEDAEGLVEITDFQAWISEGGNGYIPPLGSVNPNPDPQPDPNPVDEHSVLYTFTNKEFKCTKDDDEKIIEAFDCGKAGSQKDSKGIQVTKAVTGANATTYNTFNGVSKVEVIYCTNSSSGAGHIEIKIGTNETTILDVTKEGGTSDRTLSFVYSTKQSGQVKFTIECTTNSIYVSAIKIYYETVIVPPHEHDYTNTVVWENYKAYLVQTCDDCEEGDEGHIVRTELQVAKDAHPATCLEDGYNVYTATIPEGITNNNFELTKTETLNALGHAYNDGEWVWATDLLSATVTFTCANDAAHKEVINATVTHETTTPATSTAEGVETYTAKATFNNKEYTNVRTEAIHAHTHNFEFVGFAWNSDKTKALAIYKCSECVLTEEHEATAVKNTAKCVAETCGIDGKDVYDVSYETQNGELEIIIPMSQPKHGTAKTIANEETITFADKGLSNQEAVDEFELSNGVILTFDAGTNSNPPKYFNTGNAVRMYAGNKLTITSTKNIISISFSFATGENGNAILADLGEFEDGAWNGSAKKVVFTISGTSGHRRITEITFELEGESEVVYELTHHAAVPATFDAAGTIEYWECEHCHKLFNDENGTTEITDVVDPQKVRQYDLTHPTWSWEKVNNSWTAKVKFTCTNDQGNDLTLDAIVTEGEETNSSCTEHGHKNYDATVTYQNQDFTNTKSIEKELLQHTLDSHAAVAPACESAGNIAYWTCSVCNKYFSDANGTTEITLADTVVNALGHDYEAVFTWNEFDATVTISCKHTGCTSGVTNAVATVTNDNATANCHENVVKTYTASYEFDNHIYSVTDTNTATKTEILAKTSHNYSGTGTYVYENAKWYEVLECQNEGCTDQAEEHYSREETTAVKVAIGNTGYATLAAAIAATSNQATTITLLTNVDEDIVISEGKTITLDGAYNISNIENNGSLTLEKVNVTGVLTNKQLLTLDDNATIAKLSNDLDVMLVVQGNALITELEVDYTGTEELSTLADNIEFEQTAKFVGLTLKVKEGSSLTLTQIIESNIIAIPDGMVINNDGTITASHKAKIDATLYDTVEGALASAQTNDTIVMLVDETTTTLTINKSIILDLNHKKLTGDIVIDGSVTINNGTLDGNIKLTANGILLIDEINHTGNFDFSESDPEFVEITSGLFSSDISASVKTGSHVHIENTTYNVHVIVKDEHEEVAAGCTTAGHKEYYECTVCHEFFDENNTKIENINSWLESTGDGYIPATGHVWGAYTVTTQPTSANNGVAERVCSHDSNHKDQLVLPVINDSNYDSTEKTPATCTVMGTTTYTLKTNNTISFDVQDIDVIPHTLTHHDAVAPTCTTDGNIEYWTCSVCNKYFSDENGADEITQLETVESATGHNYELVNIVFDDGADVFTAKANIKCVTCDHEEQENASVTHTTTTEANWYQNGIETYVASYTGHGITSTDLQNVTKEQQLEKATLIDASTIHATTTEKIVVIGKVTSKASSYCYLGNFELYNFGNDKNFNSVSVGDILVAKGRVSVFSSTYEFSGTTNNEILAVLKPSIYTDATCTTTGTKAYYTWDNKFFTVNGTDVSCIGNTLEEAQTWQSTTGVIPALGHEWTKSTANGDIEWNIDTTNATTVLDPSLTVNIVCSRDSSHKVSLTVYAEGNANYDASVGIIVINGTHYTATVHYEGHDYEYETTRDKLATESIVTFSYNYGSPATTVEKTVDGSYKVTAPDDPEREHYTFAGWFDNAEGTGSAIDFTTATYTEDTTVYAKWTADTFTITFKNNDTDGTDIAGSVTATYNSNTLSNGFPSVEALDAVKPEGKVFGGWTITKDGTDVLIDKDGHLVKNVNTYTTNENTPLWVYTDNIVLYAKWTPIVSSVEVTFIVGTDTSNTTSIEKDGVTISVTSGVFNRTDNYRLYASNSMTISSGKKIKKIEFTISQNNLSGTGYDSSKKIWTGDSNEVTLSASGGQVRITKIIVTIE